MNKLIQAKLVWDGGDEVVVPEEMGKPREDQMVGTAGERLSELSLRICYDSMGIQPDGTAKKARGSTDTLKHILEVGHFSVFEHYNFTIQMAGTGLQRIVPFLFNRPGLWVEFGFWEPDPVQVPDDVPTPPARTPCIRLTMNLRNLLDWGRWSEETEQTEIALRLGMTLGHFCRPLAPVILGPTIVVSEIADTFQHMGLYVRHVKPRYPQEKWISLYMSGSRGLSHELVRHGDRTAISQRSTRYCDEDSSPWVEHPLVTAWLDNKFNSQTTVEEDKKIFASWNDTVPPAILSAKGAYTFLAKELQDWLASKGADKFAARKQARGAARGYLGNALFTELIFSASVQQWKHMLTMRAADAADAEIRECFAKALPILKGSRYGDSFAEFELTPSSDGLGNSLKGGGHK